MSDQEFATATRCWRVAPKNANTRLDAFLRRCLPHLSRREIENAIDEKHLSINGQVAKKGVKLHTGDEVTFRGPSFWLAEYPVPNARVSLPIVYEDSSLLVLDKPAGIATHGFSGRDNETVANFIASRYPAILTIGKSRWEPGLVHRLDRETSGLLLVAKTQSAFDHLRTQFERRQVKKTYQALVWGATAATGTIAYPLAHEPTDASRMRAVIRRSSSDGRRQWAALTSFRKLAGTPKLSWLEIEMKTGVTHQIRVHLSAVGHPIIGDAIYGPKRDQISGLTRHFLHASALEFLHPKEHRMMKLTAELPTELAAVLKRFELIS